MVRIFILGAYRSFSNDERDMSLLQKLRDHLCHAGFDAFLALDDRATEILEGRDPPPLEKTEILAAKSDLLFFVLTSTGRLEGVAGEIVTLQLTQPEGAAGRVVFFEEGHPLSSILDPARHGILSIPPVIVVPFSDEPDLLASAAAYAGMYEQYGRFA